MWKKTKRLFVILNDTFQTAFRSCWLSVCLSDLCSVSSVIMRFLHGFFNALAEHLIYKKFDKIDPFHYSDLLVANVFGLSVQMV